MFLCDTGDLFHDRVSTEFLREVFTVLGERADITWQILTKRVIRMEAFFHTYPELIMNSPNIWLGISVENQARVALLHYLFLIPAKTRFVSVEPQLGPVHLGGFLSNANTQTWGDELSWVICGGESGANARPLAPEWVRQLRDDCVRTKTPFFFEQWGEFRAAESFEDTLAYKAENLRTTTLNNSSLIYYRVGRERAGARLDGTERKEFPTDA